MKKRLLWLIASVVSVCSVWADPPHIGYVFPAGGPRGQTFEVTVGGQYLESPSHLVFSGDGVQASVVNYRQVLGLRDIKNKQRQLKILEVKLASQSEEQKERTLVQIGNLKALLAMQDPDLMKKKISAEKMAADAKQQLNPQLAERLVLRISIDADALDGERELRIQTDAGVSNPVFFHVGNLAETRELEPNDDHLAADLQEVTLPILINGQIMPGDIDHFRFSAQKGEELVVDVSARKLIPYMADAVPGWFQATLALFDEAGTEVAFADDYKFNPDPVLFYTIPVSGKYTLQIRDSIYRGREDFIYRISVGKLPFITGVFPLGGQKGSTVEIKLTGKNLTKTRIAGLLDERHAYTKQVTVKNGDIRSNPVWFVVGNLPEMIEVEPNEKADSIQAVELPVVVNGRIQRAGDWDVFSFVGEQGQTVALEVHARRLNSPLDSVIRLYDSQWHELGSNDDYVDLGAGLTTHHADSYLMQTLPDDGKYFVKIADTQHHGGEEYAYRLRISLARPDFVLRLEPSGATIAPGGSVTFTAHVLRKDGFDGQIEIKEADLPREFVMSKAIIPEGADQVRFTITAPERSGDAEWKPRLRGRAYINGKNVQREALAVDDQMQAFLYRHLVPANELVLVEGAPPALSFKAETPSSGAVKLPLDKEVTIPVEVYWNKRYSTSATLMLDNPPKGIVLVTQSIKSGRDKGEIVLKATAPLEPDFEDNLILKVELTRGRQKIYCFAPALSIRVLKGSKTGQ